MSGLWISDLQFGYNVLFEDDSQPTQSLRVLDISL
jgi:hypothetical protein